MSDYYVTTQIDPTWDVAFLLNMANITFFYGYTKTDTEISINVVPADQTALNNAIVAYPLSYANANVKPVMIAQVNDLKSQYFAAPITTTLGVIDADSDSRTKLTGVVQMAAVAIINEVIASSEASRPYSVNNVTFTEDWTMHDNSVVALNALDLMSINTQVTAYDQTIAANAVALIDRINSANTVADCKAIDVNSGWTK